MQRLILNEIEPRLDVSALFKAMSGDRVAAHLEVLAVIFMEMLQRCLDPFKSWQNCSELLLFGIRFGYEQRVGSRLHIRMERCGRQGLGSGSVAG